MSEYGEVSRRISYAIWYDDTYLIFYALLSKVRVSIMKARVIPVKISIL